MRKVNLLGAAVLALTTGAWSYGAVAQTAAPDNSAPPADTSSAPAPDNSAPAPSDSGASPMKKPMHKMHHMGKKGMMTHSKDSAGGDAAVDDLNAQSLDAAKGGKSFSPPTTPMATKADTGKSMKKHSMKPMHHKMAKKAAPPASGDASSSGSSDSSSTPPADSSGK